MTTPTASERLTEAELEELAQRFKQRLVGEQVLMAGDLADRLIATARASNPVPASEERERVADFLKERDEAVGVLDADDEERLISADSLLALLTQSSEPLWQPIEEAAVAEIAERGARGEHLTPAEQAAWTGYELGFRDGHKARAVPTPPWPEREADKHEAEIGKLIDERDAAEEALSQAFYLTTGRSPEWSSMFGHAEALEEISDYLAAFRAHLPSPPREG